MRILAISYLFPSSLHPNRGVFVLNRLRAVARHAEVKVINPVLWFPLRSRFRRYQDYHLIPRRETIDGIEVYHPRFLSIPLALKAVQALTYSLAVVPLALRMRKSWRWDLVDLHWTYPDLPAGRLLSRLSGVRQLVTVRGEAALHHRERGLRKRIVGRLLRRSDHVITLSDALKDLCVSLGTSADRVCTIRNGVDGSRFRFLDKQTCRKRIGVSAGERLILGIGYLTDNKGFDRIVASLSEVVKAHPRAKVYLIGPDGTFAQGDRTSKLVALAQRLGVSDNVRLVGEVPNQELPFWYNAADLFCLSSRSEGSPNVLSEALACGCPAVATDVGAVSEILADDSMGIVVPNNAEGVRSGLLSALSTSYDREKIAAGMAKYDWQWCAEKVLEVYHGQLNNGG